MENNFSAVIISDDHRITEIVKNAIEKAGVTAAASMDTVQDLLQDVSTLVEADAVLVYPGKRGCEGIRTASALQTFPEVPVIFVTDSTDDFMLGRVAERYPEFPILNTDGLSSNIKAAIICAKRPKKVQISSPENLETLCHSSMMKSLFDAFPDMIWITDNEGRFLYVNKNFSKAVLMEENPESAAGIECSAFREKMKSSRYRTTLFDTLMKDSMNNSKEKGVSGYHLNLKTDQGITSSMDVSTSNVFDAAGYPSGKLGYIRDTTAENTYISTLSNENMQYFSYFNSLPACVYVRDKEGRFVFVNRYMRERFSISRDIQSETVSDVFRRNGSILPLCELKVDNYSVSTFSAGFTRNFRLADGKEHKFIFGVFPVMSGLSSENLTGVLAIDITGSYDGSSEDGTSGLINALFENSGDGLYVGSQYKCIVCNDTLCRLTGYDKSEIMAGGISQISPDTQPDGRKSDDVMASMMKTTEVFKNLPPFDWQIQRKDGVKITLSVSASSIRAHDGTFMLFAFRDTNTKENAVSSINIREDAFMRSAGSIPLPIILIRGRNVIFTNKALTETLNADPVRTADMIYSSCINPLADYSEFLNGNDEGAKPVIPEKSVFPIQIVNRDGETQKYFVLVIHAEWAGSDAYLLILSRASKGAAGNSIAAFSNILALCDKQQDNSDGYGDMFASVLSDINAAIAASSGENSGNYSGNCARSVNSFITAAVMTYNAVAKSAGLSHIRPDFLYRKIAGEICELFGMSSKMSFDVVSRGRFTDFMETSYAAAASAGVIASGLQHGFDGISRGILKIEIRIDENTTTIEFTGNTLPVPENVDVFIDDPCSIGVSREIVEKYLSGTLILDRRFGTRWVITIPKRGGMKSLKSRLREIKNKVSGD